MEDEFVDELYFSALHDYDELFPISDEKYAEELQLQEALIYSVNSSFPRREGSTADLETEYMTAIETVSSKKRVGWEHGESSQGFCSICMDAKPINEFINGSKSCNHSFCEECMAKYIAGKIQENISMVKCPHEGCKEELEPQNCRDILPKEVFSRWSDVLRESVIVGSENFARSRVSWHSGTACQEFQRSVEGDLMAENLAKDLKWLMKCPNYACYRAYVEKTQGCQHITSRVSWHSGTAREEFQGSVEGDLMAEKLAKDLKWMRCPSCRYYVEKTEGCHHIRCRCGNEFCYSCGSKWTPQHVCRL